MSRITAISPAKLNLNLHITGHRHDGYHLLDSIVTFTAFGDAISVEPASTLTVRFTGMFAEGIDAHKNTVLTAAQGLRTITNTEQGAHIVVNKNLPHGSGLGAASSNAATVLHLLQQLWGVTPSTTALDSLQRGIGADVTACALQKPCRMQGIGEVVTRVALPVMNMVIVFPKTGISSAAVYQARPATSAPLPTLPKGADAPAWINFLQHTHNDLQPTASALLPDIIPLIDSMDALAGCQLARMTGSGSACFAMFETVDSCKAAAEALQQHYPDYWVITTKTVE